MTSDQDSTTADGFRSPPIVFGIFFVVLFISMASLVNAAAAAGHGNYDQADRYLLFAVMLVALNGLLLLSAEVSGGDND